MCPLCCACMVQKYAKTKVLTDSHPYTCVFLLLVCKKQSGNDHNNPDNFLKTKLFIQNEKENCHKNRNDIYKSVGAVHTDFTNTLGKQHKSKRGCKNSKQKNCPKRLRMKRSGKKFFQIKYQPERQKKKIPMRF